MTFIVQNEQVGCKRRSSAFDGHGQGARKTTNRPAINNQAYEQCFCRGKDLGTHFTSAWRKKL